MEALADKDLKSWPLPRSFHQTRMWASRMERHWGPLPRSRPCWGTFTERYKGMSTVRRPETSGGPMRISDSKCSILPRLTLAQVLWPILLWTKVQSRSRCKIRKMPRVFSRWKSSFRSSHAPAHRIPDTNQSSAAWQLRSTLADPTQSLNANGETVLLDDCLRALTCFVLSTPMMRIGDLKYALYSSIWTNFLAHYCTIKLVEPHGVLGFWGFGILVLLVLKLW